MAWSVTSNRGIHLGCVAAVAAALTVGVVAPQPVRNLVPVESHPVVLQAAIVSAVASSSAAPLTAITTSSALDAPVAAAVAAATADPAAIPRTIAQIAFTALGIAVSPLWYLGFPITLPWTASLMSNIGSNLGAAGWGNLAGLYFTPVAWLGFPFIFGGVLAQTLFPVPTATVTPLAATARSDARLTSGTTQTSPAALRDFGFRQASPNPSAVRSKRSIAHAAAPETSAKARTASAAPERLPVGKAGRKGKTAIGSISEGLGRQQPSHREETGSTRN